MVTTQAAQQLLSAPPSPAVVGYQGESWGVQVLRVLLCFHCWHTAKLCRGSVGDLYGFSCTRGYKPCRKHLYLSRCLPGSSQVLCPLLLPCSQQTCPTCLFLPHGRGWMEPAMGCGICKTCGPFPGSCETNLHAPCLPSCPLNAAYFSPPFFPPFCLCFC